MRLTLFFHVSYCHMVHYSTRCVQVKGHPPYIHRRRQQTVEDDQFEGQNIIIKVVQYEPAPPPDEEAIKRVH